jgi:hypothetical protein
MRMGRENSGMIRPCWGGYLASRSLCHTSTYTCPLHHTGVMLHKSQGSEEASRRVPHFPPLPSGPTSSLRVRCGCGQCHSHPFTTRNKQVYTPIRICR